MNCSQFLVRRADDMCVGCVGQDSVCGCDRWVYIVGVCGCAYGSIMSEGVSG